MSKLKFNQVYKMKFNQVYKMKRAFVEYFQIFLVFCAICLFLAIPVGWMMNIYKLTKCDFEPSYKAEVIRSVGVLVAPVGTIVGYMDLGE